jgi:hypothetical protein
LADPSLDAPINEKQREETALDFHPHDDFRWKTKLDLRVAGRSTEQRRLDAAASPVRTPALH